MHTFELYQFLSDRDINIIFKIYFIWSQFRGDEAATASVATRNLNLMWQGTFREAL